MRRLVCVGGPYNGQYFRLADYAPIVLPDISGPEVDAPDLESVSTDAYRPLLYQVQAVGLFGRKVPVMVWDKTPDLNAALAAALLKPEVLEAWKAAR